MTAYEARRLMEVDGNAGRDAAVKAVLASWHRAIEAAARKGEHRILSSAVDRLRMPIPAGTYEIVYDRLAADGFNLRPVRMLPTAVFEVSW